jgi:Holliday junction resolvasome RuvABC endonuclease subunit
MIVLGVDPSSSSSGYAVIDHATRDIILAGSYEHLAPRDKHDRETTARSMVRFFVFLCQQHEWMRERDGGSIDLVVVEQVSMTMGMHTVRMLAYSESVPILFSAHVGARLRMVQATSARSKVFPGRGTMAKERCTAMVRAQLPHLDWPSNTDLAGDMSDAIVLAQAGPQLMA